MNGQQCTVLYSNIHQYTVIYGIIQYYTDTIVIQLSTSICTYIYTLYTLYTTRICKAVRFPFQLRSTWRSWGIPSSRLTTSSTTRLCGRQCCVRHGPHMSSRRCRATRCIPGCWGHAWWWSLRALLIAVTSLMKSSPRRRLVANVAGKLGSCPGSGTLQQPRVRLAASRVESGGRRQGKTQMHL